MGRIIVKKTINPIILGYEEDLDILCNLSASPYIGLDELLFIKSKLNKTIEFAKKNNIEKLNHVVLEKIVGEFNSGVIPNKEKINQSKTRVYIMIDRYTGLYKIGNSISPNIRERTLLSQAPAIDLLFSYESKIGHETILKRKYIEKRKRGEWFSLNEKDLEDIKLYLIENK